MTTATYQEMTHQKYSIAKSQRLEARVNGEQKKLFQHAADLLGRSLTDFVISALNEVAARTIKEHQVLTLTTDDREVFFQALKKAPEPNARLQKAMKRYQKEVVSK